MILVSNIYVKTGFGIKKPTMNEMSWNQNTAKLMTLFSIMNKR